MATPRISIRTPGRQALTIELDAALEVGREAPGLLLADARASRRHARLTPRPDGTVEVTDLGSSNGTTIDERRLTPSGILESGSTAHVGDTAIELLSSATPTRSQTEVVLPASHTRTSIHLIAEAVEDDLSPELVGVADEPGTLTIAFSDIESSTERALSMGDTAWFELLRRHEALVRAHVTAHQGRVIKNQGDGFMLSFRSARQAILCAIGVQRDLVRQAEATPDQSVRIRIGLHTGEVLVDDDGDLFGRHVMVAARIGAHASGGQILVSSLVKQIAEPRGDLVFNNPADVVLKGLDRPQTVFEVDWDSSVIS